MLPLGIGRSVVGESIQILVGEGPGWVSRKALGVSRCLIGPQSAWDMLMVTDVVLLPRPVLIGFVIDAYVASRRETNVAEDVFPELCRQFQKRRTSNVAF